MLDFVQYAAYYMHKNNFSSGITVFDYEDSEMSDLETFWNFLNVSFEVFLLMFSRSPILKTLLN